ncbi:MAG: hypothetical protein OXU77_13060 [Gammaproteobacteria bacterium]|nr:hypothetical protein [Gammaproteobacteria bacterium]
MDLIDALKRFNRKERFHLLHHVLGYEGWSFRLSEEFRKDLCSNIGELVPPGALVMMDYHLDWISMAVWLSGRHELPTRQTPALNEARVVGNQEDIDLLVAFRSSGTVHIVLIEAKGDTSWSNSQLESKVLRLREMFGEVIPDGAKVRPHFVLMAPKESAAINAGTWPFWMKAAVDRQMCLPWPMTMKPTLCDAEGKAKRRGRFVRIDARRGCG